MGQLITELRGRGWPVWAIAQELGVQPLSIARWQKGERNPANARGMILILRELRQRRQIPKRRRIANPRNPTRYVKGDGG